MKNLKQIIEQVKLLTAGEQTEELDNLIWQLICYPPKMPLRLHQEQLLEQAKKFSFTVLDEYFSHRELYANGFVWGNGKRKIYITHGWGSKAADFSDIITALIAIEDVTIISFDAPGNGSSDGDLSNLLLFVQAVEGAIHLHGEPDILIGHSLGAMANIMALNELKINPLLLVSITPLIKLKENFQASMNAVGLPKVVQETFLSNFEKKYHRNAASFDMNDLYPFDEELKHWLAYDEQDQIAPYQYLAEFLATRPFISTNKYEGVGHDRVIKSPEVIADLIGVVKTTLEQ